MIALPTGCIVPLITPMLSPGELDLPGLGRLLHNVTDAGAAGVLVAGLVGEGPLLAPADRRALTIAAAEQTDGPVLVGVTGASLDELHADVARMAGAGADAVVVLAPGAVPLCGDELAALHLEVADRAEVPTVLACDPRTISSPITGDAVTRLAAHKRILGVIDLGNDVEQRRAFLTAVGPGFGVLASDTPTLLDALDAGVTGAVPALANLRARQLVELVTAAPSDAAAAARLHASLLACEDGLRASGRSLPAAIKAALQLEGLIDERWCVPPLDSVPPNRLDRIRTALLR
jgi:dihydrodipicolinate synthase/N-acetylneuraminate lyase